MTPFLALITPVSSGSPEHPIAPGGPPPGIWPGGGHPSHPIAPGGPPPGIWPGPGRPDQGLPGSPPGIWGGAPTYPDQGLPGGGQPAPLPAYTEAQIGEHPDKPNPDAPGQWVLVAAGGGVGWAWMEKPAAPPKPDQSLPGAQPKPDQGLPSTPPSAQPKSKA
jgi:hypothetical protein